jgi:hypothetical protein
MATQAAVETLEGNQVPVEREDDLNPRTGVRSRSSSLLSSPPPHPNPGMERGYSMSEMSDLQREYLRPTEQDLSIFRRVTAIKGKKYLEPRDILDRGVSTKPSDYIPRFCLDTGLFLELERTIHEMQDILRQASELVPGRDTYFIDPCDSLLPVLKGSGNLDELHIAWTAMNERFDLAQHFLDKYDAEYQASEMLL